MNVGTDESFLKYNVAKKSNKTKTTNHFILPYPQLRRGYYIYNQVLNKVKIVVKILWGIYKHEAIT